MKSFLQNMQPGVWGAVGTPQRSAVILVTSLLNTRHHTRYSVGAQ